MSYVAIVAPAYNAARFLESTVESVRQQTYTDWELILVDDGSLDGTWEMIETLMGRDERIRGIRRPNGGPSGARNTGIARTNSQWVAMIDADDLWEPTKLERQLEIVESQQPVDVVCSNATLFCDEGPAPRWNLPARELTLAGDAGLRRLIHRNVVVLSSTLVRRSWLCRSGGFDERFRMCEDYHLWLRMMAEGARFHYCPDRLIRYRFHNTNCSNNRLEMKRHRLMVLRDIRCPSWRCRAARWLKTTELGVSLAKRRLFEKAPARAAPQPSMLGAKAARM